MSNKKRIMPSNIKNTFRLDDHKPDKGFSVPEGYFEAFPEKLQARMKAEQPVEKKVRRLNFIPQLAIAASFAGLMFIAYTGIKFLVSNQQIQTENGIAVIADISDYSLEELDETMLYEVYMEGNETGNSAIQSEDNGTDDMIDYLILEDADIEVLMQEL